MIGSTLSGKTTHSRRNYQDHEHISLADTNFNRKLEMNLIEGCLKLGKNIVVDDTNLTRKIRKPHIELARKYNSRVVGIYMNTPKDVLAHRRWIRPDNVDMIVINKMLKDLEIPDKREGFDELHVIVYGVTIHRIS